MSRILSASLFLIIASILGLHASALAQTTGTGDPATDDGAADADASADVSADASVSASVDDEAPGRRTTTTTTTTRGGASGLGDEQALLEEREPVPSQRSGFEPGEIEGETYIFAGVLARALIVPQFITSVFVDEGNTPVDGGFGAYFNYRHNGFNVQLEVNYQSFWNEAFYRGQGDSIGETEFIRSRLSLIYGNVSFGWAFDITEWFAFELGFGIGFGGLIGDLYRQEAWRDAATGQWNACDGFDNPATAGDGFCNDDGRVEQPGPDGRLDDTRTTGATLQITDTGPNPFYFGGGGVPPVFFNIDLPRIAFRFKPIHQIQIRIEAAYNLYGFSVGGSLGYGF